jgi:NAD(P)-dependent dehydrogenase (short-subunit alcohol dehydrogenase family)
MSRRAIVTGSDSGIGKSTAVGLTEAGCDVGVTWHRDQSSRWAVGRPSALKISLPSPSLEPTEHSTLAVSTGGGHPVLVAHPRSVLADQCGGLEPVLGDQVGLLGAGVVELEGAQTIFAPIARASEAPGIPAPAASTASSDAETRTRSPIHSTVVKALRKAKAEERLASSQ